MAFFLNLFSPETWNNFEASGAQVTGFSKHQEGQARQNVQVGDVFLCYLVKLGRWCGALKIVSDPFVDPTPLFRSADDPFVVRFKVEKLVALRPELAVPTTLPEVWDRLSWTKNVVRGSVGWGANFQRSLRQIPSDDGEFLRGLLHRQEKEGREFPLSGKDLRALRSATTVKTAAGNVSVVIPDEDGEDHLDKIEQVPAREARESHRVQALLAEVGAKMGFRIWIPRADRDRVTEVVQDHIVRDQLIDVLPMNYNEATVRTIEQIDVLWLRGRSIARAFEVEHTTAIYSGLLRMADLVALQPDINIPLHIVAPPDRTDAVLEQIRRPVFSLLDVGPLSERCTLLTYDSVREIAALPHVQYLRDEIISEYEVAAAE